MQISIKKIYDYFYQIYFYIHPADINILLANDTEDTFDELCQNIEEHDLIEYLEDYGLTLVSPLDVRYLIKDLNKRLIVGIGTCVTLPHNVFLPRYTFEYQKTKHKPDFEAHLIKLGLYYEETIPVAKENSVVYYNLVCSKDGHVLSMIPNQIFEEDDGFTKVGLKVNDRVIIDKGEFLIEAIIQKITNKVAYTENNFEINKLDELGYTNIRDFEDEYLEAFTYWSETDDIINRYLDFLTKEFPYEFKINTMQFYKKRAYQIFKRAYQPDFLSEHKAYKYVEKALVFDSYCASYADQMIVGYEQVDEMNERITMIGLLAYPHILTQEEIDIYAKKVSFAKFAKKAAILIK